MNETTPSALEVLPLGWAHVPEVARLHAQGIVGFASSLGPQFLRYFYEAIVASEHSFSFVGVADGRVLGYVACSENIGQVYRTMLKHRFWGLLRIMAPKLVRPSPIRDLFEVLFYPRRRASAGLPPAELLAIVVDSPARGLGLGKTLVAHCNAEFRARGIERYKVLVGVEIAANEFYRRLGFELVDQYRHHAKWLNTYVLRI